MTEKVVRKTTTKKVVKRTVSKTVPARSKVQKTVVDSPRKAPIRTSPSFAPQSIQRKSPKVIILSIVLFAMVVGISALIGFSDKGQLNVGNVIATRKQSATGAEHEALQSVPTQQTQSSQPNGGLVGMGGGEPAVAQPIPVAQQVASSTSNTATSSSKTSSSSKTLAPKETPDIKPVTP